MTVEGLKRSAMEAGAQDYLVKPHDVANILGHARNLIAGVRHVV